MKNFVETHDGQIMDLFEMRVEKWIMNELGEQKIFNGEVVVNTSALVLDRILFNVIDAYRDLVRFPDKCPGCTRSGRDHDGECPNQNWVGQDKGIF